VGRAQPPEHPAVGQARRPGGRVLAPPLLAQHRGPFEAQLLLVPERGQTGRRPEAPRQRPRADLQQPGQLVEPQRLGEPRVEHVLGTVHEVG
jgi:hypothetical protein